MCELLGICFAKPVLADVSLRLFAMRDVENAHGWGLGWYRGRSLAIAKEPITWRSSEYSSFLQGYPVLKSHIFLGHVRNATVGGAPNRADTHPFGRELDGREYCFAHNGTVRRCFDQLPLGRFRPVGATDSEHVFCHLLAGLAERGGTLDGADDWSWLHERFAAINDLGKFNCVLADGDRLIAHHDANGFKGLHVSEWWIGPHGHEPLNDVTMRVDIISDGEGGDGEGGDGERGAIIATRPLTDHDSWRPMAAGETLVIEGGRLAFSSAGGRVHAAQ